MWIAGLWESRCLSCERATYWHLHNVMILFINQRTRVSAQFPYPDDDEILTELDFLRHRRLQWDGVPDGVGWPGT